MSDSRLSKYVPAAAISVVAAFSGWVATRSLQQDFAAYFVAGAARRAGLDPYVNQVGGAAAPALWDGVAVFAHSRFLYPPVVAEAFRGLALLPYPIAKAVFTALMVAAWAGAAVVTARGVAAADGERARAVALGAGVLFYPLALALERGQIDPLVLLLLAVAFAPRARAAAAGAALAAAVALKPALGATLVILAALGRWRTVGAALAGLGAVALASVALAGPGLAREYATRVLPRAALYGEGGDESMLLPAARLAAHADDLEAGVARLGGWAYPVAAWEGPASASLPRLLAPDGPTPLAARAPAFVLLALLGGAVARRGGRIRDGQPTLPPPPPSAAPSPAQGALLLWATAVACVVASPAGWVMGLVAALPLVSWLARVWGHGPGRAWRAALAAALAACAVPPPFAGWAAVSGVAVVVAAVGVARALPTEAA
jgi:hypothetical protein